MASGVRAVPVEMDEELRATPVRGSDHKVRLEAGYRQMPPDANLYIHVDRMVEGDAASGGRLVGHHIDMKVLNSIGTHIELKLYRGDGVALIVDGQEVYRWRKLDGGSSRVRAPVRKRTIKGRVVSRKKASPPEDDYEFE